MKTTKEIKELGGNEYISEVAKIILFGNDSEIKPFIKWTKPFLLAFYKDWKHYGDFDKDGVYELTMRSRKDHMRHIVRGILSNMIKKVVSDNVGINKWDVSREDVLDYTTTIRREILIDELIN